MNRCLLIAAFSVLATLGVSAGVHAQNGETDCLWVISAAEGYELGNEAPPPKYAECLRTENGSESLVIGRILSEDHNDRVGSNCDPHREDIVCLSGWYKIRIAIARTIAGPKVRGRITAIRSGDPALGHDFLDSQEVFVIRPIVDESQRGLLKAGFALVSMSEKHYCLDFDPAELGLDVFSLTVADGPFDTYCFSSLYLDE